MDFLKRNPSHPIATAAESVCHGPPKSPSQSPSSALINTFTLPGLRSVQWSCRSRKQLFASGQIDSLTVTESYTKQAPFITDFGKKTVHPPISDWNFTHIFTHFLYSERNKKISHPIKETFAAAAISLTETHFKKEQTNGWEGIKNTSGLSCCEY